MNLDATLSERCREVHYRSAVEDQLLAMEGVLIEQQRFLD
jgi:hypothetical protein